jgi:hypothetical protein
MHPTKSLFFAACFALGCSGGEKSIAIINTAPAVSLESPEEGEIFDEGEVVTFVALVEDSESDPDELDLEWTSDLDGLLSELTRPSDDGQTTFATAALSEGLHTITLKATDPRGKIGSDYMTVGIENDCLADPDCDFDEDTYTEEDGDCNDDDSSIHPDAEEVDNGVDDNCDGFIDEGTDAFDDDGDGYTENQGDCDDEDADISPVAEEVADGIDNNCDLVTDEGTDVFDDDGDGYTESEGDCNDDDSSIHPEAAEIDNGVDDNCDGFIDEGTDEYDDDGDGFSEDEGDCDDYDDTVHPDAEEVCDDDIDNDCDGVNPDEDADEDGWSSCEGDCNDADEGISPDAAEVCDVLDVDENCNGVSEELGATGGEIFYADDDDDGFGDSDFTIDACEAPAGYVSNDDDCDDSLPGVSPDAVEACDGMDTDCDGSIDEAGAVGETAWYYDGDGDDFGSVSTMGCDAPAGYVATPGDCDDTRADVNPDGTEVCDPSDDDEDCDGTSEESGATGEQWWYDDGDADSYGDAGDSTYQCDAPVGHVDNDDDCNDGSYSINPSADEVCDGIDHDCDGEDTEIDAIGCVDYHYDGDEDTYGLADDYLCICESGEIENYTVAASDVVSDGDDCCDIDWHSKPGALYLATPNECGSYDRNCDGTTEKRWTYNAECESPYGTSLCGVGASGWYYSSDPSCGYSAPWLTDCDHNDDGSWLDPTDDYCEVDTESKTQQCR